jgi:hypothetical protein
MTVLEIINQAIVHEKMSIDHVYGRTHINDALNTLAMLYDTAKVETSTIIVCSDTDDYYSLPSGCIKIQRVEDSDGHEYSKLFYKIDNKKIKFENEDTYTIVYLSKTASVTLDTETPAIDDLYHRTLSKYIAYKELLLIKPQLANLFKEEFFQEAGSIDLALKSIKKRGRYTPVRQFR